MQSHFNKDDFHILVAKCGKSIGLKGEIKLIIYSDFTEIFTKGNIFLAKGDAHFKPHLNSNILNANDLHSRNALNSNALNPHSNDFFLTLQSFNSQKGSAFFSEINNVDSAKNLNSFLLYSSEFLSKKYCKLKKDEYFWFDIIGLNIIENNEILGKVSDIERIGKIDYLIIATDSAIFTKYPHIKAKKFYLPYINRYVLGVENGEIATKDAFYILEES